MGSVALDFSRAKPLPQQSSAPVTLDFSKAQPITGSSPASAVTSPPSFFGSFANASGLSALGHVIAHPLDTIDTALKAAGTVGKAAITGDRSQLDASTNPIITGLRSVGQNTANEVQAATANAKQGNYREAARHAAAAVPVIGPAAVQADQQIQAGNNAGAAGTLFGTAAGLAAPEVVPKLLPIAGRALARTGEAAQDAGVGILNKTIGTLQKDFKRGANPARGYFQAGGGPALSMQGLADQAAAAKSETGAAMGDIRDQATAQGYTIAPDKVNAAVQGPISNARSVLSGPGGMGPGQVDAYADGFAPITARTTPYTPNEVFDLKRNIAQNTSWGDPSQVGLKSLRQQQVGALGGLLNDNLPYGVHAQNYADLTNFANRATLRAATGSQPLTHLAAEAAGAGIGAAVGGPVGAVGGILANSVPVKSTLASGLFYGGKGLKSLGELLQPASALPSLVPATAPVIPALVAKPKLLTAAGGQ